VAQVCGCQLWKKDTWRISCLNCWTIRMTKSTIVPATCITAFNFAHQMGLFMGNCPFYPPTRTQYDTRQTRASAAHKHTTQTQQLFQVSKLDSVTSGQFLSPGREGDRQTIVYWIFMALMCCELLSFPQRGECRLKLNRCVGFCMYAGFMYWCKTLALRRMMTHCSAFQLDASVDGRPATINWRWWSWNLQACAKQMHISALLTALLQSCTFQDQHTTVLRSIQI